MNKKILLASIIFIFSAIIFGAFGAHALKNHLTEMKISSFEVGVRYQLYQGLGLMIIVLNQDKFKFNLNWFYQFSFYGTILFSFSIYILAFSDKIHLPTQIIGPITPIGGTMIIISWIILAINIIKQKK